MKWSTQQVAQIAGTTSRTLRYYDSINLLHPAEVGTNGYRYYDVTALRKLQRILLLRELGLGLPEIQRILDRQTDERTALTTHLKLLKEEKERVGRLITSVEFTLNNLHPREESVLEKAFIMNIQKMFDGFDPTKYKEEVEQRWGKAAYSRSPTWYDSMSAHEQEEWKGVIARLNADWQEVFKDPHIAPDSPQAQTIAGRHVAWLADFSKNSRAIPADAFEQYVRGLAAMYPQDERFAVNYGGKEGAEFVRDALLHYMDEHEGK